MSAPADSIRELAASIRAAGPSCVPEREFRHARSHEERRHRIGGNGAPPLDEPAPRMQRLGAREVLRLGVLLAGDRYTAELARICGEDPRQVRRWRAGEGSGPAVTAVTSVRREALARIAELQRAVDELDAVRPPPAPRVAPPPPQPEPEVTVAPGVDPEDAAWFLAALARALTPGRPTFVREVLSARRPPRARHWTADVIVFDGQRHTLACDRGADLDGTTVGLAWTPGHGLTTRQPCLLWDDEAGWVRGRDYVRGPKPRPAPVAAPAEERQVDIEEMIAELIGRDA